MVAESTVAEKRRALDLLDNHKDKTGESIDWASVLDESSAGILVTNSNFQIIWMNRFEEKFYGKRLPELLNKSIVSCHKEKNRKKVTEFLERFHTGELSSFTKISGGDTPAPRAVTFSAYHNRDGSFGGILRTRIKLPQGADPILQNDALDKD